MQYHALSLADQSGYDVDVVAYGGSAPLAKISSHPSITVHTLRPVLGAVDRAKLSRVLVPLFLLLKAALQVWQVLWAVGATIPRPEVVVFQNPPGTPGMGVAGVACWLRGSKMVVDWHNYGYTILSLGLGERSLAVRAARILERWCGKMGHAHLCVTEAMARDLAENWGIAGAVVLHDRPPQHFKAVSTDERHAAFLRLHEELVDGFDGEDWVTEQFAGRPMGGDTVVTRVHESPERVVEREDRCAVVVSSTSWTADEDFSLLLDAAVLYDSWVAARHLPRLLVLVTGKGPQKAEYETKMKALGLKHVAFRTLWLAMDDYPVVVGSADLGVCLHASSSGLDLPMKVVDMLGAGIPVAAVRYACIGELVHEGVTGRTFADARELANLLGELLKGFPFPEHANAPLPRMRKLIEEGRPGRRWDATWAAAWAKLDL